MGSDFTVSASFSRTDNHGGSLIIVLAIRKRMQFGTYSSSFYKAYKLVTMIVCLGTKKAQHLNSTQHLAVIRTIDFRQLIFSQRYDG